MIGELFTSAALTVSLITTPAPTYTLASEQILQMVQESEDNSWQVQSGDTLSTIAEKVYGHSKYWTTLWNDNSFLENPSIIHKGLHLKIRKEKPTEIETLKTELEEKRRVLFVQVSPPPEIDKNVKPTPSETSSPLESHPVNFETVYKEAGEKYGVPWQVLYGLHMTETGGRDGYIMSGYGSGARGPMQFMPGTFNAYAVDGDNDGVTNIDNAKDAIHTAAHYLAKHGTLENGLKSYGGNTSGTLELAKAKGFSQ